MLFDLPRAELRVYKPEREEPDDFDAFWADTLTEVRSHPLEPRFEPVDAGPKQTEVYPFNGHEGGETIHSEVKRRRLAEAARV